MSREAPLVLGINAAYHESSAALVRGADVIFAVEEERFSRIKHAKRAAVGNPDELPWGAIDACLAAGEVERLADVDAIGYSLLPGRRAITLPGQPYTVDKADAFGSLAGEEQFDSRVRSIGALIAERAGDPSLSRRVHHLPHHLCHAASAYYPSPFDEAAVLVLDGIGEDAAGWLGGGRDGHLQCIEELAYPHSIGLLWERAAVYCGLTEYDASKLMGLAAYGDPQRFSAELSVLFAVIDEDGGSPASPLPPFVIDPQHARLRADDVDGFEALFGPRRRGDEPLEHGRFADLAAALQRRTETALLAVARRLWAATGAPALCYAGGVALNCVANGVLERRGPFEAIYIPPAAHDAGTALGGALELALRLSEAACEGSELTPARRTAHRPPLTPFLGPRFTDDECRAALETAGVRGELLDHDELCERAADALAAGRIVGWFEGALELGPRALGHRSLLADPRKLASRERLNRRVKHREPFRPFAASVRAERAADWFAIEHDEGGAASSRELMLLAYPVRDEQRALIPAVVHADGSCRVQTVQRERTPRFFALLCAFEQRTGVPLLLNTSFNDREPIICGPDDALATFAATEIDALVLGRYWIARQL